MLKRWIAVGFAGAATLGGCSGSTEGGGGAGSIPLADLPPKIAVAACAAYETCNGDLFKAFQGSEDCATKVQHQIEDGSFGRIQGAIDADRVVYDASKAQACIDEIASRTCTQLADRFGPACSAAIDGTVALGGNCTLDEECKGEAYCKTSAACPGSCATLEGPGGECYDNDTCQSGLVCRDDDKTCIKPAPAGEPCGGGATAPPCQAGLICLGGDDKQKTPGTCRTQAEAFTAAGGESCDILTGTLCKAGSFCVLLGIDTTTTPQTLQMECGAQVGAGAACKLAFPDQCPPDEYCADVNVDTGDFDGTCMKLPKEGQPCASVGGKPCGPYAACIGRTDTSPGTCRTLQSIGGSCDDEDVCYSDECDMTTGKCIQGAACIP